MDLDQEIINLEIEVANLQKKPFLLPIKAPAIIAKFVSVIKAQQNMITVLSSEVLKNGE